MSELNLTKNGENNMTKKIYEWAKSFAGCDGGNIKAKVWLCGIEWGYSGTSEEDKSKYYKEELEKEIKSGAVNLEDIKDSYNWTDHNQYRYGKSFAKLYSSYKGKKVEDFKDNIKLFKDDEIFKLNLYPISFHSVDETLWEKYNLNKSTGFSSKYLFNTWCFFNRFPEFSKLREKHNPKLIVCTGINYLNDFMMFFGATDHVNQGQITGKSDVNQYPRTYYWVKISSETTMVVIPFLSGRYGLNSNDLLQKMGVAIKSIMDATA